MPITEDTILAIIERDFPFACGIMLTGSQLNETEFANSTDIDVVVFGFQFSVVSSRVIVNAGMIIDVTQVPLYDIENILFNESFHPKGTLLSMMERGRIIRDTDFQIISLISSRARALYQMRGDTIPRKYVESIRNLKQLNNELKKETGLEERFFLTNNFIFLVSQTELLKNSNWLHSGKHRARFLNNFNHPFVKDIINLVKENLFDAENGNLDGIVKYIDYYVAHAEFDKRTTSAGNRYILDIYYSRINVQGFYESAIKKIEEHSILGKNYLYTFSSPNQYHRLFSNKLSVVFQIDSPNQRREIFQSFRELFYPGRQSKLRIKHMASYVYSDRNPNKNIYYNFEGIAKEIELMIKNQIKVHGFYDNERNLNISIILFSFIFKYLDFNIEDMQKCLKYLLQRYMINKFEQTRTPGREHIFNLKNKKLQTHHLFYAMNKDNFINMFRKGMSFAFTDPESTGKEYTNTIKFLNIFLAEQSKDYKLLIEQNFITYEILRQDCEITEANKALLFILSFEQLSQLMHIEFNNKGLSLYIMLASLNDLVSINNNGKLNRPAPPN